MNKRILFATFLLATVVRLAACWKPLLHPEAASNPDAIGYHELAAALLQGRFPSLFRTPGYPLFLVLTGASSGNRVVFALLAQMLLDGLTAVMLAAMARRLFERDAAALWAGLLYACCPVMVALCGYIANETLAIFLVTAALFLLLHQRAGWSVVVQAVLWFAATMVRPSYALLPLVASVFFLLQPRFAVALKRQVVMLSLYALLTGAWIGFNYVRAGVPTLSSNPDVSFYIYDLPALRMAERISLRSYIRMALLAPPEFDRQLELYQIAYAREEQVGVESAAQDLWFTKDDPALFQQFRAEAIRKVEGRWHILLGIHLTGVLQSLRPKWNSVGWPFRLLDALRVLALPLAVLVLLWRRQWWFVAFFVIWAGYALLPPGPVGAWRFRGLIEPFISWTLAAALTSVAQRLPRQMTSLDLTAKEVQKSLGKFGKARRFS
jgi:hypothetical protein